MKKKWAECLVFWGLLLVVLPGGASGMEIVWEEPRRIEEIIDFTHHGSANCHGVGKMAVTDDQTKMVIGLNDCKGYQPKRNWDLWMFTRTSKDDPWDSGTNLNDICVTGDINTDSPDFSPTMNGDGTILIWESKRSSPPVSHKKRLWQSEWDATKAKWGPPRQLSELNVYAHNDVEDNDAGISTDGLELFFASDRDRSNPFNQPKKGKDEDRNIWVTRRNSIADTWGTPALVPEPINPNYKINTDYNEEDVSISPDGKYLFFASNRKGPENYDLYWYTRKWNNNTNKWGSWEAPFGNGEYINPPPPINEVGEDERGFDLAGNALYFVRDKEPYVVDPFVSMRATITSIGIYGKAERTVIIEGKVSVFQPEYFIPDRWYEQKGVPARFINWIRGLD
ncbi:MAG: hypothetical protein AB1797_00380 [bacterium]